MTRNATQDIFSEERLVRMKALAKKRHRAERRYRVYGLGAVGVSIAFLIVLFVTILGNGYTAFVQTQVRLEIFLDPAEIDASAAHTPKTDETEEQRKKRETEFAQNIAAANFTKLANLALMQTLGIDPSNRVDRRKSSDFLSRSADVQLRDLVVAHPELIGTKQTIWVFAHGNIDALLKGKIARPTAGSHGLLDEQQVAWVDKLSTDGHLAKRFNTGLFVNGASSQPETAGLGVAILGSFFMMMTVIFLAVPLGVAAAIYLEEFAPKNRWTDLIEVNINNLAAVPSIVFGLLGLAVFINFLGLPRSASMVGGLVLTLMTLPTIIIATRAAINAVPPSIREAALGVGASKMQTVLHHVLPLAMPGILTGTIIGLAKALGETAPLLMIGMVAFVTNYPHTPFDSATALPVQIFMWATEAERGFVERTAAATLILLAFMMTMNLVAIILRQRFTRKW